MSPQSMMLRGSLASLVLVAAVSAAAVKEKTAGGYGAPPVAVDAPSNGYYQPPPPPQQIVTVPVPIFVQPPRPPLMTSHVCAYDVGFGTYGGRRHRSRRPTERTCDDSYMPGGSKAQNTRNCDKCCKTTTRLNGFSEQDVIGMVLIVDHEPRCTCCAPAMPVSNYAVPQTAYAPPAADYSAPAPAATGY